MTTFVTDDDPNNVPIASSQNAPLDPLGLCRTGNKNKIDEDRKTRRYTKSQATEKLAIDKYEKCGKGITFGDMLGNGFAKNKRQAQNMLKRCRKRDILFAYHNLKPQQYYPSSKRSEIIKYKSKNAPIRVTGVGYFNPDQIAEQSLRAYVLPLLPDAPLFIHNIQLDTRINPDYYNDVYKKPEQYNGGKEQEENIGNSKVRYRFYANGTVVVSIKCSNRPFRIESESDISRLMAFFGQVRDRLVILVNDPHERVVPEIMEWHVKQCDINKDIKVGDWFQFTGIKVQLKHIDRVFRIYIKAMGRDTVCRVKESQHPNLPVGQFSTRLREQIAQSFPSLKGLRCSYLLFDPDKLKNQHAKI